MRSPASQKWLNVVQVVIRIVLAAFLVIAGYSKIRPMAGFPWSVGSAQFSLSMFAGEVRAYEILSPEGVTFVSHTLPFFELFLGLWLLSGIGLRLSSVISLLMFFVYMTAIAWAWHRNVVIPSGIGLDEQAQPWALLVEDLGLFTIAALAAAGAFRNRYKQVHSSLSVSAGKRTTYQLIGVALVLNGLILAFVRLQSPPMALAVQPLGKNGPIIKTEEVNGLLSSDFRIIRSVQQIPSVVKQDFPSPYGAERFAMVDPGREMSTDMILPGVPNKRLVFAGVADSTVVVVFELGGFAGTVHVAVLSYGKSRGVWGAALDDYSVHDIGGLKAAVELGRFKTWKSAQVRLKDPPLTPQSAP